MGTWALGLGDLAVQGGEGSCFEVLDVFKGSVFFVRGTSCKYECEMLVIALRVISHCVAGEHIKYDSTK